MKNHKTKKSDDIRQLQQIMRYHNCVEKARAHQTINNTSFTICNTHHCSSHYNIFRCSCQSISPHTPTTVTFMTICYKYKLTLMYLHNQSVKYYESFTYKHKHTIIAVGNAQPFPFPFTPRRRSTHFLSALTNKTLVTHWRRATKCWSLM